MIRIVYNFIPWFLFSILTCVAPLRFDVVMFMALLASVIVNYNDIRRHYILPCTTITFFGIWCAAITIFKLNWIISYTGIISSLVLATVVFITLILKFPFTQQYAREQQPKERWNHPVFVFVNNFLTGMWGVVFLFNFGVSLLRKCMFIKPITSVLLTNSSIMVGIFIVIWFPKWYQKRVVRVMTGSVTQ